MQTMDREPPTDTTETLIDLRAERRRRGLPAVVELPTPGDPTTLDVVDRTDTAYGYCKHVHVHLDPKTRTASCADCKDELDLFRVLMEYARHERNFQYGLKMSRAERDTLQREVDELKRQRTNLRAGVRRAGGDPDEGDPIAQAIARRRKDK